MIGRLGWECEGCWIFRAVCRCPPIRSGFIISSYMFLMNNF